MYLPFDVTFDMDAEMIETQHLISCEKGLFALGCGRIHPPVVTWTHFKHPRRTQNADAGNPPIQERSISKQNRTIFFQMNAITIFETSRSIEQNSLSIIIRYMYIHMYLRYMISGAEKQE